MTRLYHQFLQFLEEKRVQISLEQKQQREKMLGKHNENVRSTVEKVGGKNLTHTRNETSVHNGIARSVIYHHHGEEHIETDLDTGHTRTTRKGNTLKQKEENHRREVENHMGEMERDAAGQIGSPRPVKNSNITFTTEHKRNGNQITTTIRAKDKQTGNVNHRLTRTVTHDLRNPTHIKIV